MTEANCTLLELPLAAYPGMKGYALDLVLGRGEARALGSRRDTIVQRPPSRDRAALASSLAASNRAWGNDVGAELAEWGGGRSVSIVAGQQVGFAGGPLLTISKIASLLNLRASLAARGIRATAFFWMATEDHDFGEVATLDWPERESVVKLRAPHPAGAPKCVGDVQIPKALRTRLAELAGLGDAAWLRDGGSFRDSFATLVAEAFAGRGLVLVDARDAELRRTGAPLLRALIDSSDEVEAMVVERSEVVKATGYAPQVVPGPDGRYALLYLVEPHDVRVALRRENGGWRAGERTLGDAELDRILEESPERISTGALTRPLLQDYVFEPAAFVGGPAEVSYYAQIVPLHARFGIVPPHVALRAHVLVAEEKVLRAIDRYAITPEELTLPADEIVARRETGAVDALRRDVGALSSAITRAAQPVVEEILAADPSMERSVRRTLRRLEFHARRLETRGTRALARREADRYRAVARLANALFPDGVPVDRRISWLRLWRDHGSALIDRLVELAEPDSSAYRITGV
ncbi:MAG: bacillithiol biosynthesis cysteine-adding enzyme BshC [Thermoanaerobaculia bacterium]|jgi:bacillithiol biosynthesis cysteine-adding enzyme BshC